MLERSSMRRGRRALRVATGCLWLLVLAFGVAAAARALVEPSPALARPGVDQPLTPPPNGPVRPAASMHALRNATVHAGPDAAPALATIIIRGERIEAVLPAPQGAAESPPAPAGVRAWDYRGKHIYPGLIEPMLEVDVPAPDRDDPGVHWSAMITPQRDARDRVLSAAAARELREKGFVAACLSPRDGVLRGWAATVSLARADEELSTPRPALYATGVYLAAGLDTTRGDREARGRWDGYPDSQMGAIALLRQTLLDAAWWAQRRQAGLETGPATALDAINSPPASPTPAGPAGATTSPAARRPLVFDCPDELTATRALTVAGEMGVPAVIFGSGLEFRRLAALTQPPAGSAAAAPDFIVPLNFPRKPVIESLGQAQAIDLRELMTWEQAPTNPRRLRAAGARVAFTTARLREKDEFFEQLRAAVAHGLSPRDALAGLTTEPARLAGVADQLGTLEPGKRASLVVADGLPWLPVTAPEARRPKIREVWIDGQRHEITPPAASLEGSWTLRTDPPGALPLEKPREGDVWTLEIDDRETPGVTLRIAAPEGPADAGAAPEADAKPAKPRTIRAKAVSVDAGAEGGADAPGDRPGGGAGGRAVRVGFTLEDAALAGGEVVVMSGVREGETIRGDALRAGGERFHWTAQRTGPHRARERRPAKADAPAAKAGDQAKADAVAGLWTGRVEPAGLRFELDLSRDAEGRISGVVRFSAAGDDEAEPGVGGAGGAGAESPVRNATFDDASGELRFVVAGPGGQDATVQLTLRGNLLDGTATGAEAVFTLTGTRRVGGAASAGAGDDGPDAELVAKAADVPADLPGLPFGPYALASPPAPEHVVFRGATVWTSGPEGTIEKGEVEIKDGKIVYVGRAREATPAGARVIDAAGKHVTPGLIDCHSHTGISGGVNEAGQAVTAEVRIGDVTNPDAVNWYRQLAGGITAVSSLHGSANPIGGQNQVNKVRWGAVRPGEMHLAGATPGIKFALGENVKQSNWGDRHTTRYPQTRMGVEAILRDRFAAAGEYAARWAIYLAYTGAAGAEGLPASFVEATRRYQVEAGPDAERPDRPRRDLELEALAEILGGTRLIHCHSYRQDEILMLARMAQEKGFRLGTYQHILEGYKVADAVRDSALGASAFSDWWAYKVEVQDAIPQAGPIMHEQGVVVSYNSDSDEMARRMNVEAGKARRWARREDGTYSVSPEEALKFVTLNPARQLKIEARVGSLEVGKDADVVVWSGPPLSSLSRCEQTWIDGRAYFTLEADAAHRLRNAAERRRLLQKAMTTQKPGRGKDAGSEAEGPARPGAGPRDTTDGPAKDAAPPRGRTLLSRMQEDAWAYQRETALDMLRRGINPADARGGECGCDTWVAP